MLGVFALVALAQCSPAGSVLPCPRPLPVNPWAYYPLNDSSDGIMHDQGPNGLDLTVVTDAGGYPSRVGSWRVFSRAHTSATLSQPGNFGILGGIQPQTIAAIQTHLTVGFSFIRAPLDGGSGLEVFLAVGTDRTPFNFDVISVSGYRTFGTCAPDHIGLIYIRPDAGQNPICFTGYTIVDGRKFHATIVMDPTSAGRFTSRLYIDGVLTDSIAEDDDPRFMSMNLDGGVVAISHRAPTSLTTGQVGGYLRNVAIYPRVLTPTEILDLASQ